MILGLIIGLLVMVTIFTIILCISMEHSKRILKEHKEYSDNIVNEFDRICDAINKSNKYNAREDENNMEKNTTHTKPKYVISETINEGDFRVNPNEPPKKPIFEKYVLIKEGDIKPREVSRNKK